jgi:hypothetical protein
MTRPDFDLDLGYGHVAEELIETLLRGGTRVEVKHKRRVDWLFYVELEQNARNCGVWRPSGLATTDADMWAIVFGDTGMAVLIPTRLLREAAPRGRPTECAAGDNPTRGVLLDLRSML